MDRRTQGRQSASRSREDGRTSTTSSTCELPCSTTTHGSPPSSRRRRPRSSHGSARRRSTRSRASRRPNSTPPSAGLHRPRRASDLLNLIASFNIARLQADRMGRNQPHQNGERGEIAWGVGGACARSGTGVALGVEGRAIEGTLRVGSVARPIPSRPTMRMLYCPRLASALPSALLAPRCSWVGQNGGTPPRGGA